MQAGRNRNFIFLLLSNHKLNQMIYKTLFITILVLPLIRISNPKTCQLNGKLENMKSTEYLYMEDLETNTLIDSFKVVNGVFNFELELEHPKPVRIYKNKFPSLIRHSKVAWLEASEIKISGNSTFMNALKIEGSKTHNIYKHLNLIVRNSLRHIEKAGQRIILDTLAVSHKVKDKRDPALKLKLDSVINDFKEDVIEYLIKNNDSYASLGYLYCISSMLYFENPVKKRYFSKKQISMIFNKFPKEFQEHRFGKFIEEYISLPEVPNIGEKAIDIVQPTPDGKVIKLSSLQGKYVLVYFWGSACGSCRYSFTKLKELYEKYKPLGLEIYAVSCDKNKKDWQGVIEEEQLPWINVSDLKGLKNTPFLIYDIRMLPSCLFIGKDGEILDNTENKVFDYEALFKKHIGNL